MRYQPKIKFQEVEILRRDRFSNVLSWKLGELREILLSPFSEEEIAEEMAMKWIEKNIKLYKVPEYKNRIRGHVNISYIQIP